MDYNVLDNPVYYALEEEHHSFAWGEQGVRAYKPQYVPFASFTNRLQTEHLLSRYAQLSPDFYVVGEQPIIAEGLVCKAELICCQMLLSNEVHIPVTATIELLVSALQKKELRSLVNLVQPGYFKENTTDLGRYYGIYEQGKLVAVSGERMQLNHFTEISAVVTHPQFTGKGYAKQLVYHTAREIKQQGKIPFLHVKEDNRVAIHLYQKLGFITRRKISFWHIQKLS